MTPPAAGTTRNNSASLRRALAILLYIGDDDAPADGVSLAAVADDLEINKSTASRLLRPLCDVGLVSRDAATGLFRLGARTAKLGQTYLDRLDLRSAAHDSLVALAQQSGETAHLVLADPPEVIYVDKVDSPQPVRMHSRIGHRQPMYCTAVGKAILAQSPAEDIDRVIAGGMPPHTDTTITDPARLRAELETIRRRGFALDNVENEPGVRCVAAAITGHDGGAYAALSISGPATRFVTDEARSWGPRIHAAAAAISTRLGVPA